MTTQAKHTPTRTLSEMRGTMTPTEAYDFLMDFTHEQACDAGIEVLWHEADDTLRKHDRDQHGRFNDGRPVSP